MPLSWNEIRQRSITFGRNWSDETRERAEAQTFWNEFFDVFGIRRRTVATFEEPVRNLAGTYDFIDLLWPGKLITEHKSRGGNLSKAHSQAMGYIRSLHDEGRPEEAPRYIIVSDFARVALHDLEELEVARQSIEFPLAELPQYIRNFAFIAGYETRRLDEEDPANFKATELLANLHDRLEDGGYTGHNLQRFMVRILFCLFAEDTGIFEPGAFSNFIRNRTCEDGSDAGAQLNRLFEVLNQPQDERQANLDEDLAALPYVNGELFAERLSFADFNLAMRTALLGCCNFRWEKISPAVFGSLFQNIMQAPERRQIGAHYTSERDIMKLIRSLFLDDLRSEFESIRRDKRALARFHQRLGELRFLDPACGCGNFLVIAYRELRRLELDVIQARFGDEPSEGDIRAEARLNVSQFHGIEIEEWPVRIAEVGMWLMDHQMNAELFTRFGQVKATTPLSRSPRIVQGNALRMDWNEVLPATECSYVLGNPPFVGKSFMTGPQKQDMAAVFEGVTSAGVLDYVTAWYMRAGQYIQNTEAAVAFVSTNSITQGEQVGVLWRELFRRFQIKINFGHRTFVWASEARGRAHVHVVIIGFGHVDGRLKQIYDYEDNPNQPTILQARNISPYLVEAGDTVIQSRTTPLCTVPPLIFGSKATDGGHLIMSKDERDSLSARQPGAAVFIRPYLSAEDFIHNKPRYCIWLVDSSPEQWRHLSEIVTRVGSVREFRLRSKKLQTRQDAKTPSVFAELRQPRVRFLAIPKTSSERRRYIPIAFLEPGTIVASELYFCEGAEVFHFGVLTSEMHMVWVRQVCGRLKSDYRYSNSLIYNNYPWPSTVTESQRERVETAAQAVLDARGQFPDSTLADLYDPNAMPAALRRAHERLDRAVDACYRRQAFDSERQRLEFLFALYEELVAPLTGGRKRPRARRQARE